MARGSDINQRIVLTGAEEVQRHLESIAAAGQRAGNTTRAALIAATQGAGSFTTGARNAAASSGQMRFALQNLSFQVNDVATSLASGGDIMRVFAQQGGQVFQAFQQGGGLSNVLGAAASAIGSMITPTTAAVAGLAALAGGVALLALRAESSDLSARRFDAILKATGNTTAVTGKQLEEISRSFHGVGISTSEAREELNKFLSQGGDPRRSEQLLRIGAKVRDIFGDDKMKEFFTAAAQGGQPLADFAKFLRVVPPVAEDTSKQLEAAAASTRKFNDSVSDLLRGRGRSIAEVQRSTREQIADLTRRRGTPEEEIQLQARRQIEQINRDSDERLVELQRQRNAQLAEENRVALAKYNADITAAAAAALDKGQGLFTQIEQALDRTKPVLNPFQEAVRGVSDAWNNLLDTMAKSQTIQQLITDIGGLVHSIEQAIQWIDKLAEAWRQVPGAGTLPIPTAFRTDVPFVERIFKAEGGPIRGPGGPTADRVPLWGSSGEFMMKAAAVRHWGLPFMEAINSIRAPVMPQRRMPSGFAGGGLVTTAGVGGGVPVHFHLDGGTFPLSGERNVVAALTRAARKSSMLSAGRKPSTA